MKSLLGLLLCAPILGALPARAEGKGPITVGLLVTLSGPDAAPGHHAKDSFDRYLQQHAQQLGGRDVNLVVVDDELKPDLAAARARRLIERDKATFIVGPTSPAVLAAILGPVTADAILISPSAAAGQACAPYLFVTASGQADDVAPAIDAAMTALGGETRNRDKLAAALRATSLRDCRPPG